MQSRAWLRGADAHRRPWQPVTPIVALRRARPRHAASGLASVALGGLLSVQFTAIDARFDDVNARFDDLRADLSAEIAAVKADLSGEIAVVRDDLRRMDDRLRAVEIAFGKVDQRLETLERLHLPGPDAGE